MPNHHTSSSIPEKLLKTVQALDQISKDLIDVMDAQIQAIISSESEKVEELTEQNATLQAHYKQYENDFVSELQKCLSQDKSTSDPVRLSDLKEVYPAESSRIDEWEKLLSKKVNLLQQKHNQVSQLLEFALVRNAGLMHSIYSLSSQKNDHYKQDGEKAGVSSGVAINQEI